MRWSIIYSVCCGFLGIILFLPLMPVFASCETDFKTCEQSASQYMSPVAIEQWINSCKESLNKCQNNAKKEKNSGGSPEVRNYGLDDTAIAAGLNKSESVASLTGKVVGVVLSLVGIAFFLLMLYGGFLWMIARGDEPQAKKARDIIIDAVIGIIIVAAAGIITSFVFSNVVPK